MATMTGAARLLACGELGRLSVSPPRGLAQRARLGRPAGCAAAKESPSRTLQTRGEAEQKSFLDGVQSWAKERVSSLGPGAATPLMSSAACSVGFHLQAASLAWAEEAAEVEYTAEELTTIVLSWGFYAILYFLVIPAITYNYLRLRWYKRNAAETFFQFLLVFVFFPGMLLLAPFINFRRLPKDGTEPP